MSKEETLFSVFRDYLRIIYLNYSHHLVPIGHPDGSPSWFIKKKKRVTLLIHQKKKKGHLPNTIAVLTQKGTGKKNPVI